MSGKRLQSPARRWMDPAGDKRLRIVEKDLQVNFDPERLESDFFLLCFPVEACVVESIGYFDKLYTLYTHSSCLVAEVGCK
ncbi:unnamed protein product [Fusarium graminearum]|uniref:Chromosome 3, complete genome n=2 Tax=Gibberella zeae TaxID=5518 RepID=A0A0E0SK80_GIBZE|nr:hypothetical protein FG05_30358 [Fusarium graminearum]CAF3466603.1 unnamed protein product [Fusarium graminearum]CAF3475153.1 unnamed protein product [Fusarium graminearum]CAF3546468.1 unnamed protein product [Fusarium graminearum]CAG2007477.1 unnamed protein product [Fusarium graminearum]